MKNEEVAVHDLMPQALLQDDEYIFRSLSAGESREIAIEQPGEYIICHRKTDGQGNIAHLMYEVPEKMSPGVTVNYRLMLYDRNGNERASVDLGEYGVLQGPDQMMYCESGVFLIRASAIKFEELYFYGYESGEVMAQICSFREIESLLSSPLGFVSPSSLTAFQWNGEDILASADNGWLRLEK